MNIIIKEFDKVNWEEAFDLSVTEEQKIYLPSISESLLSDKLLPSSTTH